jgi:SAM-dependent methyltransferase
VCNRACLTFGHDNLLLEDVQGKAVLEVGARNVNGSLRQLVESFEPSSYLGVDIHPGPGVDSICNAEELVSRFGPAAFDLIIATEVVEHVHDWCAVVENFKAGLRENGGLLITTRSFGFPYHEAPWDFWRYETDDMESIFSDMVIERLQSDPEEPGVFLKARKPAFFTPRDLSEYELYSVPLGCRAHAIDKPAAIRYEGKLVTIGGASPEEQKVYVVLDGAKRWIVNASWIGASGYHWPEDVCLVSPGELDTLPLGEPITAAVNRACE